MIKTAKKYQERAPVDFTLFCKIAANSGGLAPKNSQSEAGVETPPKNRMITAAFVIDVLPSWEYQNVRLKTSFFLNSGRRERVGYAISISDRCKPEVGERARKV